MNAETKGGGLVLVEKRLPVKPVKVWIEKIDLILKGETKET